MFSAKVLSLGYPSLSNYIALKYSGQNEPFISPPRCLGLTSNEPTSPDLDTTYIDEEEDDIDKKAPVKKSKTTEKKEKSPEGRKKKKQLMLTRRKMISTRNLLPKNPKLRKRRRRRKVWKGGLKEMKEYRKILKFPK